MTIGVLGLTGSSVHAVAVGVFEGEWSELEIFSRDCD